MPIDFQNLLQQFERPTGNFDSNAYLAKGKTQVILVADPRVETEDGHEHDALFQSVKNYYAPQDNMSNRYMAYFVVVGGDALSKLPPYNVDHAELDDEDKKAMQAANATHRALPFVIPTTAMKGVIANLADGWQFATVNAETGAIENEPSVFTVNRTGEGLNTEYTVTTIPPSAAKPLTPEVIMLPNKVLTDAANDYTEWQLQQQAEANGNVAPQVEDETQF